MRNQDQETLCKFQRISNINEQQQASIIIKLKINIKGDPKTPQRKHANILYTDEAE